MSDDLVARLRAATPFLGKFALAVLCREAADAIDKLHSVNLLLRQELGYAPDPGLAEIGGKPVSLISTITGPKRRFKIPKEKS